MSGELTLVVPLKGRAGFTNRLLRYLDLIDWPYPVIMADGSDDDSNERAMPKSPPAYPLDYRRYPADSGFKVYFAKCRDALARVATPYVMWCDNDDFPVLDGIRASLAFLEARPDYVAHCGRIAGIRLMGNGATGRINGLTPLYRDRDYAFDATGDALDRVGVGAWSTALCYPVTRIATLRAIWEQIANTNSVYLVEAFLSMGSCALGKCRVDHAKLSYVRQYGTSMPKGTVTLEPEDERFLCTWLTEIICTDKTAIELIYSSWRAKFLQRSQPMRGFYPALDESPLGPWLRRIRYLVAEHGRFELGMIARAVELGSTSNSR